MAYTATPPLPLDRARCEPRRRHCMRAQHCLRANDWPDEVVTVVDASPSTEFGPCPMFMPAQELAP
jgi:hypothetical protein